jgi:Asp-tRNA(Asn)/Glu-tRNA(Gln) amidotransferase A subunit family amidase
MTTTRRRSSLFNRFKVLTVAICVACAAAFASASNIRGQAPSAASGGQVGAFDVMEKSIDELQRAMRAGEVTSRRLVELYLARIDAYDKQGPTLNAIVATNPRAREVADALDAERRTRGARGPLHGIPILVKDNYETIEMPTSAGSIALARFHPARDAYQIQRLKSAGAVILGKTNMHELAAGIITVGSRFGQTKNPYDLDRNPGGSSGGTGSAVAANFAVAGMGSDTCGSIRNPASHNNLVGLRGTQGLSSRTGIVPLSSTQDIGGPLARSITDLAILLDATVGQDAADPSTSISNGHIPPSYRAGLSPAALKGARLGVLRSLFGPAPEDQEIATLVLQSLDRLKVAGAELVDIAIPGLDDLLRDSSMINSDFKFDLARYLESARDAPVKSLGEILERGLFHSALEATFRARNGIESRDSEASRRARIKRTAIRQAVEAVIAEHRLTAVVYPTLRRKPARIGDPQGGTNCQLSAHSGLPALGVPVGFTDDGLPIGVDLLGEAFDEPDLLSLGYAIERTLQTRLRPFSTPALVDGKAPAPRTTTAAFRDGTSRDGASTDAAALRLTFDETTSSLQYDLTIGPQAGTISSIWVHSGTVDRPGAARHLLFAPGQPLRGSVTLSFADRRDLAQGRLIARLFWANHGGSADVGVMFPR